MGKYLDLAKKPGSSLRKVPTPFLEDNEERSLGATSGKVNDDAPFQTEDNIAPQSAVGKKSHSTENVGTLANIAARVL